MKAPGSPGHWLLALVLLVTALVLASCWTDINRDSDGDGLRCGSHTVTKQ